ncbi:MAG: DUF393 domain-containing protein, partial [Myxococcales bacterium]|nr:DUF393 domain-containing protein [Myxococcales bacterium]
YDSDCGVCHASARLLARLDRLRLITFVGRDPEGPLPPGYERDRFDAEREESIIAWEPGGERVWTHHHAVGRCVAALPLGRLVAWVFRAPGLSWLLGEAYRAFAARRHDIGAWMGFGVCGIAQGGGGGADDDMPAPADRLARRLRFGLAQLVIVVIGVACLTQVLVENRYVTRTLKIRHTQPEWARMIVQYGRLFQGWSMFAPDAPTGDGWVVIDAELGDGTHVDPQTGEPPVIAPLAPGLMPGGQFWGSYTSRLASGRNRRYRDGLVEWLRNDDIDRLHIPAGVAVRSVVAWWVPDRSPTPGSGAEPRMEPKQEIVRWPRGARSAAE